MAIRTMQAVFSLCSFGAARLPSEGHPCEQGEAQAQGARLRASVAADAAMQRAEGRAQNSRGGPARQDHFAGASDLGAAFGSCAFTPNGMTPWTCASSRR